MNQSLLRVKMVIEELRNKLWNQCSCVVTSIGLAVAVPWLIYRIMKGIYVRNQYKYLTGKVVVITGASSGLGEALAHEFYKWGCQLVLCSRRKEELDRVRTDLLKAHPTVPTHHPIIMYLDLNKTAELKKIVADIIELTGHIDILVNNGGISHRGTVLETSTDVDIKIMNVNYFGTAALTKAVLPSMLSQGFGHIVQISSIQGLLGLPHRSAYSASKHALQGFSDSLRAEVTDNNIQVTVVTPGYVKTNLSLNAITGTGTTYGQMDKSTQQGQDPEYIAAGIVRAVVLKKKEVVISTFVPKVAIFLRKYLPEIYFYVMARRARTAS